MADTKTYSLICPDCGETFDLDLSPSDVADGAEPIMCPECDYEAEWEFDEKTDTLTLIASDEDDTEEEDLPEGTESEEDEDYEG